MTDATRPRVYVFYDYSCPYAYVGNLRAKRLAAELSLEVVHLPWEIHPTTAAAGEPRVSPRATGWVDTLAAEVGGKLGFPDRHPNTNLALRGAEYAKDQGAFAAYHKGCFEAFWSQASDISDERVLADVAKAAGMDPVAFLKGIRHQAYQARLDEIDRFATKLGVQRVPTFVFGDQRIVGNDRFEPSLRQPLKAFLERWGEFGDDSTTTLEEDVGLEVLL
ncbi:MAG: DsbA family protein [Candidatus Thermoplasmatota archaeon]